MAMAGGAEQITAMETKHQRDQAAVRQVKTLFPLLPCELSIFRRISCEFMQHVSLESSFDLPDVVLSHC